VRRGLRQLSTARNGSRTASARATRRALPAAAVLALAATVPSATPAAAAPAPFTSCAPDAKFRVSSVDVTPQPLVAGKKVSISVSGTLDEKLTGGTYQADVRYMGFSVLQRSGSIGELTALPAGPGPTTMGASLKVPREAPEGSYELVVSALDQNNATLTCLIVPFRVR
jgi:hypothetical protein